MPPPSRRRRAERSPAPLPAESWLFTLNGADLFGIAGLWRADSAVGEAFTMLTCEPAPDVALYRDRSIVILPPAD